MNFNRASADAVQALQLLMREARQVETRVATGLKVSDPRDNGAVYAIAMGQKSRIASYVSIDEGISRAKGLIDATLAAGSSISEILKQMKTATSAALSEDLTSEQRLALQSDYDALRSQIDRIASAARFSGANIAAPGGSDLDVVISDQSSLNAAQKIRTSNSVVTPSAIQIASRSATGVLHNGVLDSIHTGAKISADGRYVAFVSTATNLTPDDTTSYQDIFVKDLQTGGITRVSTNASGVPSVGNTYLMDFSRDGNLVLFASTAPGFVPGDTNGFLDVFVKNIQTGAVTRVSTSASGAQGNSSSWGGSFSADNRYVLFDSASSNLVSGDTNNRDDVFLKDLQTGAITRLSTGSAGQQATGASYRGTLSSDARLAVFESEASNIVSGDTNGAGDLFLKNIETGVLTRISTDSSGAQANGSSFYAAMSSDGRFVAFSSNATNLVPGDTNGQADLFLKDLQTGAVSRISTDASGAQATGGGSPPPFWPPGSIFASFSGDGRYIAFQSTAANLVPGDTNDQSDIFIKDLQTGEIIRVSADASGGQSNSHSVFPSFSFDGRSVAFISDADNLVPGDANGQADVFVRSLSSTSAGLIPGLAGYVVGNAGVTTADDTQFRIDGTLIGTVDITATMTVADYLEAVSTSTGGRVSARYDLSAGEFTYETAAISGGQGVLTLTSAGTARSWLGHGLTGANDTSGQPAVITLTDQDWTVGGSGALSGVSSGSGQLLTAGGASLANAALDTALVNLNAQMALLGAKAKAIELQDRFNASFLSTMEKNLSNLVDADLARESARLQSLQIKQQLGTQALSIANQAPQMILSLFRG
ncbi:MAG: PD40 domain-containing protein [Alphaproteobacteria bacterium]|nr:PD40 domain-containing protein [Alphaproteobacteria bacterium]